MNKLILTIGCFFGLTAVVLGAFGAHILKEVLSESALQSFQTGVEYQMYHALLLLLIGSFERIGAKTKKIVCYLLTTGTFLFSGSIYLLATNSLTSIDFTVIALLTPLGGTLLILAWLILLIGFAKLKFDKN
ncbi:MAG TPA: DUF423 domain-containing protein [Flavobacteriaceae bacterium]|nr:DUF423 domain-containing protein [Flavobacteriaceae bacterium]